MRRAPGEKMSERSWLVPSVLLTIVSGAWRQLVIMPNYSGVLPALGLLPLWLIRQRCAGIDHRTGTDDARRRCQSVRPHRGHGPPSLALAAGSASGSRLPAST